MADEAFLGVSPEELTGIGKLAVAAGRLEAALQDVAYAFRIDPATLQAKEVAKRVRARAVAGDLPAEARTAPEPTVAWIDRAVTALEDRNLTLHSVLMKTLRPSGEWASVSLHLRSGTLRPSSADRVGRVAQRLAELWLRGTEIERDLLPEPSPGVFIRYPRNGIFVLIHHGDDPDFPRPTDEDLDAWWATYSPTRGPLTAD